MKLFCTRRKDLSRVIKIDKTALSESSNIYKFVEGLNAELVPGVAVSMQTLISRSLTFSIRK